MNRSIEDVRMECLSLAVTMYGDNLPMGKIESLLGIAEQFAGFVFGDRYTPPAVAKAEKLKAEKLKTEKKPAPKPEAAPETDDGDDSGVDEDAVREEKLASLTAGLTADQRMVMKAILGRVKTQHLDAAYKQYLPQVLKD